MTTKTNTTNTAVEIKSVLKNSEGEVAYVEYNTPYKRGNLLSKNNFEKRYPGVALNKH